MSDEGREILLKHIRTFKDLVKVQSKPLELIIEDARFKSFFSNYADFLSVVDAAGKYYQGQFKDALLVVGEIGMKKVLKALVPKYEAALGWASWAKKGLELFKDFVFDPWVEKEQLETYIARRKEGLEPEDACASLFGWGHTRERALKQMKDQGYNLDLLWVNGQKGTLSKVWEDKLQYFVAATFEAQFQKEILKEAEIAARKKIAECDEKLREILLETSSGQAPVSPSGQAQNTPPLAPAPLKIEVSANALKVCTGEKVSFGAKVSGGVKPYQYTWFNAGSSLKSMKPSVGLTFDRPGEKKIRVIVTDSQTPEARQEASIVVLVRKSGKSGGKPELKITSVTVDPSVITAGKEAQVTAFFKATNFEGTKIHFNAVFVMETSSHGPAHEETYNFDHTLIDGHVSAKTWFPMPTRKDARPGPIKAIVWLKTGDLSTNKIAHATIAGSSVRAPTPGSSGGNSYQTTFWTGTVTHRFPNGKSKQTDMQFSIVCLPDTNEYRIRVNNGEGGFPGQSSAGRYRHTMSGGHHHIEFRESVPDRYEQQGLIDLTETATSLHGGGEAVVRTNNGGKWDSERVCYEYKMTRQGSRK